MSLFLLSKRDPNTGAFLGILRNFWEQLFCRTPPVAASEGLHHGFFTGKFPDGGKLYQQLELEYLNQRMWWDVYVCFMILLNVLCIMLNKFNKNSFRHPNLSIILLNRIVKNATFPCVINGWNKPDSDIRSSSPEGVFCNASMNLIRPTIIKPYNFVGCFGSLSN